MVSSLETEARNVVTLLTFIHAQQTNKASKIHGEREKEREYEYTRVKGESGALDPAGEDGRDPVSPEKFRKLEVLRIVMHRVTGISSDKSRFRVEQDKVRYFRSLLRPFSGWGPATVSSQSMSSRPMSDRKSNNGREENGGNEVWKRDCRFFFFFFFGMERGMGLYYIIERRKLWRGHYGKNGVSIMDKVSKAAEPSGI